MTTPTRRVCYAPPLDVDEDRLVLTGPKLESWPASLPAAENNVRVDPEHGLWMPATGLRTQTATYYAPMIRNARVNINEWLRHGEGSMPIRNDADMELTALALVRVDGWASVDFGQKRQVRMYVGTQSRPLLAGFNFETINLAKGLPQETWTTMDYGFGCTWPYVMTIPAHQTRTLYWSICYQITENVRTMSQWGEWGSSVVALLFHAEPGWAVGLGGDKPSG
jgi:hypothetical protein